MAQEQQPFRFSPRPNRAREIRWREWEPEAFAEAAQADKPILLSLSAVWCHWCHVMDETSYSDEEVIGLINQHYIPIRVDNDRRPDINARYNMGGWPTTAFLTPEGETMAGATYVPPGPMRQMLAQVALYYRSNRQEILQKVQELAERRRQRQAPSPGTPTQGVFQEVLGLVVKEYDPVHGGFGLAPKFPHPEALELLVQAYRLGAGQELLEMAKKSLTLMAQGGLFDQEWGGFFRYSTTQNWRVPHFEKMLEDNAKLLRLYLLLSRVAGRGDSRIAPTLAAVAGRVMDYIDSHLWVAQGYFAGSQDADEEFYSLTASQRRGVAEPYVDRTCYTGWNALAARAYLEASWTLGRPEARQRALEVLDFLWRLHRPGQGLARYYDGEAHMWGLLEDQLLTALALLEAAEVTGDGAYFPMAEELASLVLEQFRDGEGAFLDLGQEAKGQGHLALPQRSLADNALAGQLFQRLHVLTRREGYRQAAEGALAAFAQAFEPFGLVAAGYGLAVGEFLGPWAEVNIVGDPADGRVQGLLAAALALPAPYRSAQVLAPGRDGQRLAALALPPEPSPAAYLCHGTLCSPPVAEPAQLREALGHLREAHH